MLHLGKSVLSLLRALANLLKNIASLLCGLLLHLIGSGNDSGSGVYGFRGGVERGRAEETSAPGAPARGFSDAICSRRALGFHLLLRLFEALPGTSR